MDWLLGGGVIILMQLFAVEADICRTRSEKNPDSGKFRYILSNPMDDEAGYWLYEKGSNCSCYINLTSVTYISTEVASVYSTTNLELTRIWDNTSQTVKVGRIRDRVLLQAMTAERYFSIKIESKEKGSGRIEIYYEANTSLPLICSEEDLIKEKPITSFADTCNTSHERSSDSDQHAYILSNPKYDQKGYWNYSVGSYCSCYINLTSPTCISTEVRIVNSTTNLELTRIWDKSSKTEKLERISDRALLQAMTAERYFSIKIESKQGKGSGRIEVYYEANTSLPLICSEEDLIKENPTTPITSLAPTSLGDKGFVSVTSIRDTIVYEEKQESSISLVLMLGVSGGVLVLIVIIIGIVVAVKRCPRSGVSHRKGSKSQENPDQRLELVAREGGAVYEEIAEAFAESYRQESENEYDDRDVMRGLDVYAEIPGPVRNEAGYATATSPGSVKGPLNGKEGTALQSELPKPSPIPFQIQVIHGQSKNGNNVAAGAQTAFRKDGIEISLQKGSGSDGSPQDIVYAQVSKKKQGKAKATGSHAAVSQTPTTTPSTQQVAKSTEQVDPAEQVYAQVNKVKQQPGVVPLYDDCSSKRSENLCTLGGNHSEEHGNFSISAKAHEEPKKTLPSVVAKEPIPMASPAQTAYPNPAQQDQNGPLVVPDTTSPARNATGDLYTVGRSGSQDKSRYGLDSEMSAERSGDGNNCDCDTYDHIQFFSITKKINVTQQK